MTTAATRRRSGRTDRRPRAAPRSRADAGCRPRVLLLGALYCLLPVALGA